MSQDPPTQTKDLTQLFDTPSGDTEAPAISLEPLPNVEPLSTEEPITTLEPPAIVESVAPAVEPIGEPEVEAAYPFHLTIEGKLSPQEQSTLIEWLKANDAGIRDVELQPQFESGRVLLPRISEYVGIAIVQLLRTASVQMRLTPSPTDADDMVWGSGATSEGGYATSAATLAQPVPVFHGPLPPTYRATHVLGLVSLTMHVPGTGSQPPEIKSLQDTIDRLTASLSMKAKLKQATHVIDFKVDLAPEATGHSFRLTVLGTAVQAEHSHF